MAASPVPARILIIDIDGLRQDVFHQALSTQQIPHLAGLLANSTSGETGCHLDPVSTAPSITFCAQSSIFTGRPPEEHGAVGNQFFDRFGNDRFGNDRFGNDRLGRNHFEKKTIPRFYAFDVGDALAYNDAVLTFTGELGLLGQTLNPATPTLYEIARQRGIDSTVLYHMLGRGATDWIRPSLVDIARFTKGGGLIGLAAEQYDTKMMELALAHLRSGARPGLLTVYFMGLDHTSHEHGPGTQLGYLARVVDPLVGRLVSELERLDLLVNTLVVVVSDHGQIEVVNDDRHSLRLSFPFDREMGYLFDALHLDVHDKPGEGPACDAVVASNGGLAHVYIRRAAGRGEDMAWSDLPRFQTDVLPVAQAFWEAHQTGKYAPDLRGALSMVLVRNVEAQGWQANYQALTLEGSLLTVEDYLAVHPEIQTVDAPARLRLLACPTAGDLLLVSNYAEGFYFGAPTVGVHGGLHPEESLAVGSLGWTGASAEQWAALRQAADSLTAARRAAEGRTHVSISDIMPILMQMMGWSGE